VASIPRDEERNPGKMAISRRMEEQREKEEG